MSHCFICYSNCCLLVLLSHAEYLLIVWCGCAGSSLEVEIETDSSDAVEIKTEAASNDTTEYQHNDTTSTGKFSS